MPDRDLPSTRSRAIVLLVAFALLALLASSARAHVVLLQLFDAARSAIADHPVAGPLIFVSISALSAMLAFVSSAVLVPAATYAWGPAMTVTLLWLGWMLGGVVAYGIAATAGHSALRWLVPGRQYARYEERLRSERSFGFVLLFQLALPSELPSYILGLVRYPFLRYIAALALGELPYAVGTVMLGESLVAQRASVLVALGAVSVVALLVLGRALRRRMA